MCDVGCFPFRTQERVGSLFPQPTSPTQSNGSSRWQWKISSDVASDINTESPKAFVGCVYLVPYRVANNMRTNPNNESQKRSRTVYVNDWVEGLRQTTESELEISVNRHEWRNK